MKKCLLRALPLILALCPACYGSEQLLDIGLPDIPENSEQAPPIVPAPHDDEPKLIPLTAECITNVSHNYGVHPDILFAILLVEGGSVGETNKGNKNGTKDLNLFQFNESNIPELASFGITRDDVLNDGCLAAAIATRHLLRSIDGQPVPTNEIEYLTLIARYHSKTPEKNAAYALKLKEAFEFIYANDDLKLTAVEGG